MSAIRSEGDWYGLASCSVEAVVVEGRMQVLDDDPMGLFYRMTFAVPVK